MLIWNKTVNKYYFFGKEILEEEYKNIMNMLYNKPQPPDGYEYCLNENLEWELYELPQIEEETTIEDKAKAYDILMGVSE